MMEVESIGLPKQVTMDVPCYIEPVLEVFHEEEQMMSVGSVEVEYVLDENGEHIVDRIVLLPPTGEGLSIRLKNAQSLLDDDDGICYEVGKEGGEIDESYLEQLTVAVLEGCHCGPCLPYKSALRSGKKDSSQNRGVSFSCLEIHEFNMTLGDHPAAVSGPPVAIDWNSQPNETVINLDEYERTRNPRRKRRQLKLSYRDRKGILEKQQGFSTEEVNQAWAEALKIRQQRKETLQRGPVMSMWDEFSESTARKYKRILETVGLEAH